jgi:hypothetical protein
MITPQQKEQWLNLLRDFPVAVNNFYGDPFIQWKNTCDRLTKLVQQKHTGPVGIITKAGISDERIKQLQKFQQQGLKLVVFCSISELVDFEKVPQEPRYENLAKLQAAGIPNIAYVRPMTPPYNTSTEIVQKIIQRLANVHADAICLAGFRGDDALVKDMKPDEKVQWTLRIKILTKDVYQQFKQGCEQNNMHLFLRTACAIAYVLGEQHPYNPYYNSPNLCKCTELHCPLIGTCKNPLHPKEGALEFLNFLGFDIEQQCEGCMERCSVEGDKRLGCLSCCTTCYKLHVPRLYIRNQGINLGTLTFARFVSGMLSIQEGMRDFGDTDVGFVRFPNFPEIDDFVCINTWSAYAQHGKKCFDCKYCIEKYYKGRNCDTTPVDLLERIEMLLRERQ